MRPPGRGDNRLPPGRLLQDTGGFCSKIEQSPGSRRRRIEVRRCQRFGKIRTPALLSDHLAAITVDRERHDRVRKTLAIVIEVKDRIGECMPKRMMQGLVRISHIETR